MKSKERRQAYYQKNKHKWRTPEFKAKNKQWREANKKRLSRYNSQWFSEHSEYRREYIRANGDRHNENVKLRYREKIEMGLCALCKNTRPTGSRRYCERHYIKDAARRNLGIYSDEVYKMLRQKLIDQSHKCPYTGREITLGMNSSLDHIKPVSKFPELKSDLSNIEWVDESVNFAKHRMSREEFIEMCYQVADYQRSKLPID